MPLVEKIYSMKGIRNPMNMLGKVLKKALVVKIKQSIQQ